MTKLISAPALRLRLRLSQPQLPTWQEYSRAPAHGWTRTQTGSNPGQARWTRSKQLGKWRDQRCGASRSMDGPARAPKLKPSPRPPSCCLQIHI